MAGMWVHEVGDSVNPFAGTKTAVTRAMAVTGCTIGTDYDTASLVDYPIGGGNPATTCQQIDGCPADHPPVVCALPCPAPATVAAQRLEAPCGSAALEPRFSRPGPQPLIRRAGGAPG
jgi:hypothetical protein